MKLVPFLSFLDQIRIFHWQTFSYAEHKALGKAYDDLSELFDKFIETYYGKYGKNILKVEFVLNVESYSEDIDITKVIGNKKRALLSYIRTELLTDSDKDLLNIADEIEGSINHLLYLLQLK